MGDLLCALGLCGLADLWFDASAGAEAAQARALHALRAGAIDVAQRALVGIGHDERPARVAVARAAAAEGMAAAALAVIGPLVQEEDAGALALAGVWEAGEGRLADAERHLRLAIAKWPGAWVIAARAAREPAARALLKKLEPRSR